MISHNLIAIAGYKNSGKDTAANMLQYLLNSPKIFHSYRCYKLFKPFFKKGKYEITSFAYPLKRTLAALLNVPIEKFNDRNFKENYYIYFPTFTITNFPEFDKVLNDSRFSRLVNNKDLSFLKTHYITIRQLLQVFGTECMRNIFGDKLWILSTLKNTPIIISDLRFKIEAQIVKEHDGKIIYISRDIAKPGNHASEKEIAEMAKTEGYYDVIINNNTTLEDLFNQLKAIIQWY